MLGKLIKQEFKASYKLIVFVQLLMLIFAVLGRFICESTIFRNDPNDIQMIIGMTFTILYIGLIFVVSFACQIYVAVRFYRSLFSSQGYLSFTLPVTPTQLLHSRIVVATVWGLLSILIIFLSLFITCYTPTLAIFFQTEVFTDVTITSYLTRLGLYAAGTSIVGVISGYLMIFSCICIGQLFNKNRVVASIIAYGVMYTILQIVTTIISFAVNFDYLFNVNTTSSNAYTMSYFTQSFSQTLIISLVLGAITYVICYYIMNKKLNLV